MEINPDFRDAFRYDIQEERVSDEDDPHETFNRVTGVTLHDVNLLKVGEEMCKYFGSDSEVDRKILTRICWKHGLDKVNAFQHELVGGILRRGICRNLRKT